MIRKLITLFVLFYVSFLFTGCNQQEVEEVIGGGNLAPLSTLSGSFVFQMDEREGKIFEMEFNRISVIPELPLCDEEREHDGDFQKIYVNLDNGSLRRVESRLEEAGECMVHEEVISYEMNDDKGELVYTDNEGHSGVRYIRKTNANQFFVKNSKLEGRWSLKFEEEVFVGEVISAQESFAKMPDAALPNCPQEYQPESMTTGLVFYIDRSLELQLLAFGPGHENGCIVVSYQGHYEEKPEQNKLEMNIYAGNDVMDIQLEYEFKNDNQFFFDQI